MIYRIARRLARPFLSRLAHEKVAGTSAPPPAPVGPTDPPEVPTSSATSPAANTIRVVITPSPDATGHRVRLRRQRNNGSWGNAQTAVDLGTETTVDITRFNSRNAIQGGSRQYGVSVQAYNDVGDSAWSAWEALTVLS